MRESDQASVVRGALALSRDFSPFGADFYNYEKTWICYWILAAVFKFVQPESLSELVVVGNGTAFVIGWLGISSAVVVASRKGWGAFLMCGSVLITPIWLLSMPLLSSNIMSAGFLGLWVVLLELSRGCERRWFSYVLVWMAAFLAVGSRVDAALVLPALCLSWWGIGKSWDGILKEGLLWASFVGAVSAVGLGYLMPEQAGESYAPFFKWQTFAGFYVFGMGGVLFWYIGLLVLLIFGRKGVGGALRWREVVWFAALLLPVLFYGRVLYSPRHLMTGVLVICLCGVFSASQDWLRQLRVGRIRCFFVVGLVALVCPYFVGVRLKSISDGSLVVSGDVTLYPTADGHWPMGRYLQFCSRLRQAAQEPIDHNQRVWGAWENTRSTDLPNGGVCVFSFSLWTYGQLWCEWVQRECVDFEDYEFEKDLLVGDDRTLLRGKFRPSVSGGVLEGREVLWEAMSAHGSAEILSDYHSGRILHYCGQGTDEAENYLEVVSEVSSFSGGNGYVVTRFGPESSLSEVPEARRWLLVEEDGGKLLVSKKDGVFSSQKLRRLAENRQIWYAWSELPLFFDVNRY